MSDRQDALERYCALFEALTPGRLKELGMLVHDEVRFCDPFNDVRGRARFLGVLEDMFQRTEAPAFLVRAKALAGETAFIRWDMTFRRGRRRWSFAGVSEVHFDEVGLVVAHIDHWDSGRQFYAKLPLLGGIVRAIQGKLAV